MPQARRSQATPPTGAEIESALTRTVAFVAQSYGGYADSIDGTLNYTYSVALQFSGCDLPPNSP